MLFYFIHILKAKKSTQIKNAVFIPSCRQISISRLFRMDS